MIVPGTVIAWLVHPYLRNAELLQQVLKGLRHRLLGNLVVGRLDMAHTVSTLESASITAQAHAATAVVVETDDSAGPWVTGNFVWVSLTATGRWF